MWGVLVLHTHMRTYARCTFKKGKQKIKIACFFVNGVDGRVLDAARDSVQNRSNTLPPPPRDLPHDAPGQCNVQGDKMTQVRCLATAVANLICSCRGYLAPAAVANI